MAEPVKTWKCQRRVGGVVCGQRNPKPKRKCSACGGHRAKKRAPKHRAVLDAMPYSMWVALYGERCGICGCPPKPGKKLHRDHDHRTGLPRGLLCFRDNSALRTYMTLDWMRRAVGYLERAEQRGARLP